MKRTLMALVAGVVFVLALSPTAQADSFLTVTITVSGGGTVTDTFNSVTDSITENNLTINGVTFTTLSLTGNSPGSGGGSFATDSKSDVINNNAASVTISVGFAQNGYMVPAGFASANATQTVDNILTNPSVTETFTGHVDNTNSLTPGTGTAVITAPCTTGGPGTSCNQSGTAIVLTTPPFGLNGVEQFGLVAGGQAQAQASMNLSSVPEPSSVLLLGVGMLVLAGRKAFAKRQ